MEKHLVPQDGSLIIKQENLSILTIMGAKTLGCYWNKSYAAKKTGGKKSLPHLKKAED